MRVFKGIIGSLGALWIVARWIIERFGFFSDASELSKGIRGLQVSPNWLASAVLLFCLVVLVDAIAPTLVSVPLRKWIKLSPIDHRIPVDGTSLIDPQHSQPTMESETDAGSRAREVDAWHFAQRCNDCRYDQATIDLAFRIAGTSEALQVREKMLPVLFGAKPSQDALEAFVSLFAIDTPSDLATIRNATGLAGDLARAESAPNGISYRYYLERLSRLLAQHLGAYAALPAEDARQITELVRDLRAWGLGQYAEPIERSLATVLGVFSQ